MLSFRVCLVTGIAAGAIVFAAGEARSSSTAPFAPTEGANLVVLYTANRGGEMFPCGCRTENTGGLDREAHLFAELAKSGVTTVALEAGGLLKPYTGNVEVERVRLQYLYRALPLVGYDAINVGAAELRLGAEYLKYWEKEYKTPLVSANVVDAAYKPLFERYRILERKTSTGAPLRIGVTGVTGLKYTPRPNKPAATVVNSASTTETTVIVENTQPEPPKPEELKPGKNPDGLERILSRIMDYRVELPKVLAEMKGKYDLLIILYDGGAYEAENLARTFQPDLILTNEYGEPNLTPVKIGKSYVNYCGSSGKNVGRMDMAYKAGGELQLVKAYSWSVKRSDPQVKAISDLMTLAKRDIDQIQRAAARPMAASQSAASRLNYQGAEVCRECHPHQYEQWSGTEHASTYDTLIARGHNEDNPEMLRRAVTGFGKMGGFVSIKETPQLANVQCEECHGPGHRHVVQQRIINFAKMFPDRPIATDKTLAPMITQFTEQSCAACHDARSDPKFNFAEALKRVSHPNPEGGAAAPTSTGAAKGAAVKPPAPPEARSTGRPQRARLPSEPPQPAVNPDPVPER